MSAGIDVTGRIMNLTETAVYDAAYAAGVRAGLERAKQACEERAQKYNMPYRGYNVAAQESEQCAADIRALMAEKA